MIRNRIAEIRTVTAQELRQNPQNWRKHPARQADALRGVLSEVGIAAPLIAYHSAEANGALTLIDGHMRLTTGGEWPCAILDVDDAEARLLLATFDPISALAETDAAALDALLADVATGEAAVQELLEQMGVENKVTALKDVEGGASSDRGLNTIGKVKPVLFVEQLATFERAIRSTGLRNRGEALIKICEYYLDHAEKRQLDFIAENSSASQRLA